VEIAKQAGGSVLTAWGVVAETAEPPPIADLTTDNGGDVGRRLPSGW
jgi:hypothetical protein